MAPILSFHLVAIMNFLAISTFISTAIYIWFLCLRYNNTPKPTKEDSTDSPHVEQKLPKKNNKNIAIKKRKNRNSSSVHSKQSNRGMEDQTEGNIAKNEMSDESDKRRGRNKRKGSSLSKFLMETSSTQTKIVKTYTPLPVFAKLQLEPIELYRRLLPYVLITEQLRENGYPLESPDNPGKAVFNKNSKFKNDEEDPTVRWCCRCGTKFSVSEDGLYEADSVCYYHWGKRHSIGGISGAGSYSCCGQSAMSEGCTCSKHHVSAQTTTQNAKFVKTRDKRFPYPNYHIYALDCEMCYTMQGLEVTRISVVGPDGLAIYDSYVLPENPVLDYNTTYSGITANDLKDVTTTLADVQAFLLKLLSARTILIGHALENDLKALRLIHETIIDTSVVFPHQYGLPYKRSLKSLSTSFLKRIIQDGDEGHDSVEDARTCVELMLWKMQSDSRQQYIQPSLHHHHHVIPAAIPPTPQWATHLSVNRIMTPPCTIGYWVPPVGSCCELY